MMDKTRKNSAASRTVEREGSIWGLKGRFCVAQVNVLGFGLALSERLGCEILVPPEPLITGALGAALLGGEIYEKALRKDQPPDTKPRVLETVQIL
jgi:hypothetical protein